MARKEMWPTPTSTLGEKAGLVTSRKGREGGNLLEAVAARILWPTPTASDHTGAGHAAQGGVNLRTAAAQWPTPTAGDSKASGSRNTASSKAHPGTSLTDAVRGDGGTGRLWPTPNTVDAKLGTRNPAMGKTQEQLCHVVKEWPTPMSRDWKSSATATKPNSRPLSEQVEGALNPTFVEYLLGLPRDWTVV